MDDKETKEISVETLNEVKQNKKRRKKRHKKSSHNEQILLEEKKDESKNEITVKNEEAKEVIEDKGEPKIEINQQIKKEEINIQEAIQSTIIKGETICQKDISNSNNEEQTQENKDETIKKSKGAKKNKKRKGKKEEKNEVKNIIENKGIKDSNKNDIYDNTLDYNHDKDNYPIKEIDPLNLISVDEDDGEIDYLKAEQAYELSVLLESHKFFRNIKNLDEKLIKLIRRRIVRYERNLSSF